MIGVLYLVDYFPDALAGTEKQVVEILRRLDRTRFRPVLASLDAVPAGAEDLVRCPVVSVDLPRVKSRAHFRAYRAFRETCRRHRVVVVQSYLVAASFLAPMWARLARVPVVVASRRNVGYWQRPGDVLRYRLLRRLTTHWIANSSAAAAACVATERAPRERVSVVGNGIDVDAFASADPAEARETKSSWGFPADAVVVGAVGNLREVKDHATFVRAAAEVAPQHPNVRFVVVGEGELRSRLEREIDAAGLSGRFVLAGRRADVARVLAAFDVGVLPSRSESLSNAVLEYMAAGLPVVATRVGGVADAVRDGVDGHLCPSGDPPALASAIRRLLVEPGSRRRLGDAGRNRVRAHFSWDAVMRRTEALYERLAAEAPSRSFR